MRKVGLVILVAAMLALAGCGSKFKTYNGPEVTQIYVQKSARRMYLLHGNSVLKAYDIDLGTAPAGHKQFEGDGKTPEGGYFIDRRNPNSRYYLSLGISYPNEADRAFAAAAGRSPGGDIFIHGRNKASGGRDDWTVGCIAVKDREIEDIYAMVRDGTPIFIAP
jgi:murein L,D-transpeptidase YafK